MFAVNWAHLDLDLVIARDGLGNVVDAYVARSVIAYCSHGGMPLRNYLPARPPAIIL